MPIAQDITLRKQLEREVLAISERERSAFSRELHDSLGQQLSGISYLANVLLDRLRQAGSPEAAEAERIFKLLKQALEQTRSVARGLAPIRSEPDGLVEALRELAARSSEIFGIDCRFCCPRPLLVGDGETATHLYRIAQEAVHNAIRHGQAKRITIGLTRTRELARLRIVDNGRGIGTLSPRRKGMGLRIMQYRAGLLQGTVSVGRRPGGGTEVCCIAPAKELCGEERGRRVGPQHGGVQRGGAANRARKVFVRTK
jgi:signal transduction histidine kinase